MSWKHIPAVTWPVTMRGQKCCPVTGLHRGRWGQAGPIRAAKRDSHIGRYNTPALIISNGLYCEWCFAVLWKDRHRIMACLTETRKADNQKRKENAGKLIATVWEYPKLCKHKCLRLYRELVGKALSGRTVIKRCVYKRLATYDYSLRYFGFYTVLTRQQNVSGSACFCMPVFFTISLL